VSTVLPPAPPGVDTILARSWALFKRGWIVALPPFIGTVLIMTCVIVYVLALATLGIVAVAARHSETLSPALLGTLVIGYVALLILSVLVALWMYAAMFGMADALWERGTTSLADGFTAFRTRGGALFVAGIGFIGLAILAVVLALPTLGLALLAFPLFTMYAVPAIVSGGRGGFEAIGESFRLVRSYFVPSLIAVLVLYGIWYGVSFLGSFAIVPLEMATLPDRPGDVTFRVPPPSLIVGAGVGYVISLVVSIAYSGFVAIGLTGLYRELTGRAAFTEAAAPPSAVLPG